MTAAIDGEDAFIYAGGQRLRRGYTTGSCAAAASKAAAQMLLGGGRTETVDILTPKGILLHLGIEDISSGEGWVRCAVRKDGGDDVDDTDGVLVYSTVKESDTEGIRIDGGEGVGRVTRRGLDQPPGNAAINRVPRNMIAQCIADVCGAFGRRPKFDVIISVKDGESIAARTFNPRLGIEGGISIIGTSGIVEPMSEAGLLGSIRAEASVFMAQGRKYLLTVPGNYGKDFVREFPELEGQQPVECSNFIGDFLDMAVEMGAEGVLLVGNLGKLVKVAGGIMNTHSRNADSRMEILASNALLAGADAETARAVMGCISTDDALEVLDGRGLVRRTMDVLVPKIEFHMDRRVRGKIGVGAIVFSSEFGTLGMTPSAGDLLKKVGAGQ